MTQHEPEDAMRDFVRGLFHDADDDQSPLERRLRPIPIGTTHTEENT